ncbi:MAG: dihydrofolate reductase family protein [Flavobacteriales bacterium]|nr:dihydrofolate reductase family protein [Flavobacteriales bacterium]
MRKLISFFHISLDGFVAGPNGEMNWITIDQEIFDHVGIRIGTGDMAMYGRVTYQMMENYWPTAADKPNATKHDIEHSKWYKHAHKVVLSNSMKDTVLPNTTVISDNLIHQVNAIKNSQGENQSDILVFGSPTATHALMEQNLIDGFWLFVNPIVLGKGIPLFVDVKTPMKLQLISTKPFTSGVTELNYVVKE